MIFDKPTLAANSPFFCSLMALTFAIFFGLLANYSRLCDFRYTSWAARGRWLEARKDAGEWLSSEQTKKAMRRHEFSGRAECLGRCTWWLLKLQLLLFFVGILLFICAIWHSSHPKPWNDKAMITEYAHHLTIPPTGNTYSSIEANYFITNITNSDYQLSKSSIVMIKIPESSGLRESPDVVLTQDVFIPSKQKVSVSFRLPLQKGEIFGEAITRNNQAEIKRLLLKELQDVDGFVVFDQSSRYEISFSNGWKRDLESETK
jgi:hypothetical protein